MPVVPVWWCASLRQCPPAAAVKTPKYPPALLQFWTPVNSPMNRQRKVISRSAKTTNSANGRSVAQTRMSELKMKQPERNQPTASATFRPLGSCSATVTVQEGDEGWPFQWREVGERRRRMEDEAFKLEGQGSNLSFYSKRSGGQQYSEDRVSLRS